MTYSSISVLPVLLTILLLALDHTSEGIEYHVKPTDPEVTQCPGQPCQTLAEYMENTTWDYTSHSKVVFMPGHHRVARSFLVRFAVNLTMLGSTSVNHTLHDTCPTLHIASIWFDNIIYLNLTGIIVIRSYELKASPIAALKFTSIFTLRVSQIAVHSKRVGTYIDYTFGNSFIEHSSFDTISHDSHICMYFRDSPLFVENPGYAVKIMRMLHPKGNLCANISIKDCIFTSVGGGSIFVQFEVHYYPVQIDISNITTVGEHHNVINLGMETFEPYVVRIRDSSLESNGSGTGIFILSYAFSASQRIQISNCTLAGHRTGIEIIMYSRYETLTHPAPEIEIKRTIIIGDNNTSIIRPDQRGVGLKVSCEGIGYAQPSVMIKDVLFSSTMNYRLTTILPSVVYMEFPQNVSFVDCNFTGNRGTPIVAISSHFSVSGTIKFINNTGYEGGALAFYDDSFMNVHSNTHILFTGNYAQRVGGAIYVKSYSKFKGFYGKSHCFFQLPNVPLTEESLQNLGISFTFVNNKARDGGDAIYGGMLHRCKAATRRSPYFSFSGAFVLAQNNLSIATYTQPGFSKITSDPTRVCLCKDEKPDCYTTFATKNHYPGETFTVSAVVVGEELRTVNGTVYAHFLPLQHSEAEPSLREPQQSQRVGHDSCTELKYSIHSVHNLEILVLTAQDVSVPEYLGAANANYSNYLYPTEGTARLCSSQQVHFF